MDIVEQMPDIILTHDYVRFIWTFTILKRKYYINMSLPRLTQPEGSIEIIEAKMRAQSSKIVILEDKLKKIRDDFQILSDIILTNSLMKSSLIYGDKIQQEALINIGAKCNNIFINTKGIQHLYYENKNIEEQTFLWKLLVNDMNKSYIMLPLMLKSNLDPNMKNIGKTKYNVDMEGLPKDTILNETLLHVYCSSMSNGIRIKLIDMIELLLKYGADKNIKTTIGETPLQWLEKASIRGCNKQDFKEFQEDIQKVRLMLTH